MTINKLIATAAAVFLALSAGLALRPSDGQDSGPHRDIRPNPPLTATPAPTPAQPAAPAVAWGEPVQGVSAGLRLDKTIFAPGEEITFELLVRNNSSRAQKLFDAEKNALWLISADSWYWREYWEHGGPNAVSPERHLTLEAGETWRRPGTAGAVSENSRYRWIDQSQETFRRSEVLPAGNYQFRLVFRRAEHSVGPGWWWGELATGTVAITISDGPAASAEATPTPAPAAGAGNTDTLREQKLALLQQADTVVVGVSDGLPLETFPLKGRLTIVEVLKGGRDLRPGQEIGVHGMRENDPFGGREHYYPGENAVFLMRRRGIICVWPDATDPGEPDRVRSLLEQLKTAAP